MLQALLLLSRDNIVCNRSLLKWVKAEAVFTEMQGLRAQAATLPPNATPIPTVSLAEVTRAADMLSNCPQAFVRAAAGGVGRSREFALDVEALQEEEQMVLLETIVRDRCGGHAARLLRIIMQKMKMETRSVWDYGLVSPKTLGRPALYAMLRAG